MQQGNNNSRLPSYQGQDWIQAELPAQSLPWLLGKQASVAKDRGHLASSSKTLQGPLERDEWHWPKRPQEKIASFEGDCEKAGLSLRWVYAAALKWQQQFLHPHGEFSWFFEQIRLAYQRVYFLFVHAGLDDRTARLVSKYGIKHLNQQFQDHVKEELIECYYGPLANMAMKQEG